MRCAGEASGAGPAARGRAGAEASMWARASCFSTRNKVGRPKSSRGPGDLQRARGGSWWSVVLSDEDDPGGCGHLLPILRTAVGRGLRGSLVGRRGVRPRAGSGSEAIFALPRRRFEGLPEGFRRRGFDGAVARGGLYRFGKNRVFRARRRRPGKVAALRSATFSRAPPGCGCRAGGNPSLSLLSARAARDFFGWRTVLNDF